MVSLTSNTSLHSDLLDYMRLFYQAFPIRDALRHELSWTQYRLMLRVSDDKASVTAEANTNLATLPQTPREFVRDPVLLESQLEQALMAAGGFLPANTGLCCPLKTNCVPKSRVNAWPLKMPNDWMQSNRNM